MKITEVKVWLVEGVEYNWTLLEVYTDTGHTGVGEATNWPGSPIIEAAAKHVGERVIGLDPMRTDFIWTKLYRDLNWIGPFGVSMCAISGLDMALLDLKAKVLGVPMYQLLGGAFRTSIPLYANYWFIGGGHTAEDYASQARKVREAGFGGLKFDPFAHTNYLYGTDLNTNLALTPQMQDRAVEITGAVRDAIGPEMDMMIETHAMMNGQMAVKMAERLAPFGMTWYEEPAGPENANTLRALRERLPGNVSICVGERHYTRHGFRPVLENHICDVIMPDITRCGGPSEMKRIATKAEAYNVAKTAITGMVRALAIEWGPFIRVVGVAPGFINTSGNQAWFDSFPDPAQERRLTEENHPVGRIGSPAEVGNLCAFLVSPLAGFITGDTILMDGGRSALMQDNRKIPD